MKIARFDPPGLLDDFDDAQRDAWSVWISNELDSAAAGEPATYDNDAPRAQFFNPSKVDIADDQQTLDISWTAFPKRIASAAASDLQRWRAADASRDVQDEYCEWSVQRDDDDKVVRVTFTCEGPEYWTTLAGFAPDKVLALYQKFISPHVQHADLFPGGVYDRRNRWNASTREGAMHLIQGANTLHAEIELAGGATIVRTRNGQLLTDEQALIRCGQYGAAGRHSDPHIGERVNSLTRAKADVTLANPIGLYFDDLVTAGWVTPDGSDPKQYWSYLRGTAGRYVRAVYEVPPAKGFVVGDIEIGGKPIRFGGQIADFIKIKLTGLACRFGKSTAQPMTACKVERPGAGLAELSVASMLAPRRRGR